MGTAISSVVVLGLRRLVTVRFPVDTDSRQRVTGGTGWTRTRRNGPLRHLLTEPASGAGPGARRARSAPDLEFCSRRGLASRTVRAPTDPLDPGRLRHLRARDPRSAARSAAL